MAAVLADLPKTLVHGSFRPRNALLARGDGEDRVAVIDWELAARGSGLYDLAFFAQGFRSPQLDVLIDAYRRSAARHGLEVPDSSRTRELLDWFRVHKELKSLGDAHDFAFPEPVVDKILCLAEAVRPGGITS
jgi:aminoglycoside phosphotransferase (APT) family kinase protein